MAVVLPTQQVEPPAGRKSASWLWTALALAAGAFVGLVLVPAVVPPLGAALSAEASHAYWYISRASAFVAFALLWISMLAGLGITSKLSRFWPGLPMSFELHRFTALLGLGFGLVHAFVLLGDQYMNYSLAQLLVPFMGDNYRPEWVGLGQIALYSLAVVALSFYVRDRLGVYAWRMIHALSFALFVMVLIHGLQSGTDSGSWWALSLYIVSAASVLFGSIYRVLAVRTGRRKQAAAASGLIAVGGQAPTRLDTPMLGRQGRAVGHPPVLRSRG